MTDFNMTFRSTRRMALSAVLGLAAIASPLSAFAQGGARDAGAEAFVQSRAQKIIGVLADKNMTVAQKNASFHTAIDELADVPRVTNFVLGKYARTITPEQKTRFSAAFRTYAEGVYQNRLGDYHGENLKVTGSVVRKPGDVIVNTVVAGGQVSQPLPVAWRVLNTGGAWKVVDVQVSGVWLAITQQQDFVSTIDNAGGNIDVLIGQLQRGGQRPTRSK